jgi:predicted DNA-binding protein with PD1-like motif
MRYHDFGDGRYVLRLDAGDDLISSLADLADREHIDAGHVTGLGSVERITLGFLDPEVHEYVRRRFEEPMEVAQLTGTISVEGDRHFVHLHAVVAPRELLAYGGHVHDATVGVVMELFVTRFPGALTRLPVAGQPFPGLFLPGESPPGEHAADAS